MAVNRVEQLRSDDVRRVFEIVEVCKERWFDPDAWRRELLEGALRLIESDEALMLLHEGANSGPNILARAGRSSAAWRLAAEGKAPVLRAEALHRLMQQGDSACSVWDFHALSDEASAAPRKDDGLGAPCVFLTSSLCVGRGAIESITVGRGAPGRTFSTRDVTILRLLHGEVSGLIGTRLATERQRSVHGLPSRCGPTLNHLLDGRSEKEIAAMSHRSVNTIHEHVTTIYRHFDVSSRGELLAYFLRRRPLPLVESAVHAQPA